MSDTRTRIREAALGLFISKGFNQTSIGEIEEEAGLAPRAGGFYRHYASKVALVVEIGETIIESPRELGFEGLLPLGDTRAELVLIAKGYLKASDRQAPLARLIAEVGHLKEVRDLERRVTEDLLRDLSGWLAEKTFACEKGETERAALLCTVFGGWLFYLSKRGGSAPPEALTDEFMIEVWADFWADTLDHAPRGKTS